MWNLGKFFGFEQSNNQTTHMNGLLLNSVISDIQYSIGNIEKYYNSWLGIAIDKIGENTGDKTLKTYDKLSNKPKKVDLIDSNFLGTFAKILNVYGVVYIRKIKISKQSKNIAKLEILQNDKLYYSEVEQKLYYLNGKDKTELKDKELLGGIQGIGYTNIFDMKNYLNRKTKIDVLFSDLKLDKNLMKLNNKVILNGGRDMSIYSTPNILEDEEVERFNKQYKTNETTNLDKSSILLLENGMKFESNFINLNNLLFGKQLDSIRDKILSSLGVSKIILGIADSMNRSNIQEVKDMFYIDTIKPIIKLLIEGLQNDNDLDLDDIFIDYMTISELNSIREDWKYGLITKNTYLKITGKEIVTDGTGDEYYIGNTTFKQGSDEEQKKDEEKEY